MNLHPLSLADILDYSLDMFFDRLSSYLAICLVVQLPSYAVLFSIIRLIQGMAGLRTPGKELIPVLLPVIPLVLSLWVLIFLAKALVTLLSSDMILNRKHSYAESARFGIDRFGTIAGYAVLSLAVYALIFLIPFSLLAYATTSLTIFKNTMPVLTVVTALSLCAALYCLIRTSPVLPLIMIQNYTLFAALRKAGELTRSDSIRLAAGIILSNGIILLAASGLFFIAWWIVPFSLVVMMPLVSIVDTLCFYDVMIRREAYDLFIQAQLLLQKPEEMKSGVKL